MKSKTEIIQFLHRILKASRSHRAELVRAFQDEVWNDESIVDNVLNDILSELAYELDFYESNEKLKKESLNYYGDERLEEIVKSGIQRLEEIID